MKYKDEDYGKCVICGKSVLKDNMISTSQGYSCTAACATKSIIDAIYNLHKELSLLVNWFDEWKDAKRKAEPPTKK